MKDLYNKVLKDKNNVLIVLAHPDDMEITCGGTAARLLEDGKNVRSVVTTDGQRGMHESDEFSNEEFASIRKESQVKAGLKLGLSENQIFNLGLPDGQVENTFENIGKVVWHIRDFKPDIIITHQPTEMINWFSKDLGWINHRDHRMTAEITLDASYPYSSDHGFYREQIEQGLTSHSVSEFLFADAYTKDNAIGIEITKYIDIKRKALDHHKSGGVLSNEEIDGFIEETEHDNKNFEVMGYVKVE